jgi:hypothetical protein
MTANAAASKGRVPGSGTPIAVLAAILFLAHFQTRAERRLRRLALNNGAPSCFPEPKLTPNLKGCIASSSRHSRSRRARGPQRAIRRDESIAIHRNARKSCSVINLSSLG